MYDYLQAVKDDVREYIEDNDILTEYSDLDKDDLYEKLNDDLWTDDSVTGNGSGSYTFDRNEAKEYLFDSNGFEYFAEMIPEFGIDAKEIADRLASQDWEWFDVSIRCYLLGQAISEVLDELM